MTYSAASAFAIPMPMVSVTSVIGGVNPIQVTTAPATGAPCVANGATYVPFHVVAPVVVKRLWVLIATTGGTDTWDLGLYTSGGVQIVHNGSVTAGTANTIQFMDITDTLLTPGEYYMGISSSGTTAIARLMSVTGASTLRVLFCLSQATAHPLPATATFATDTVNSMPVMGYCTTATP